MRKDKLIKLLQEIKGNPDILLWNGYVGDWADIDPEFVTTYLTKQTKEDYLLRCRHEKVVDSGDASAQLNDEELSSIDTHYRQIGYSYNQYITDEDVKAGYYKKKNVVIINAKLRGETTFDRFGNIGY